ncbi:MAG: hypothetical protein ACK5FZ_16425, partial [Bacteroidota bacterium]
SYFGKVVVVAFNKSAETQQLELGKMPSFAKAHFGGKLEFENSVAKLTLKPYSFEVIEIN